MNTNAPLLRTRLLLASAVAILGLTASSVASADPPIQAQPQYPALAPFCPGDPTVPVAPGSQQVQQMQSCDPRQLFMLPRNGNAPQFLIIGDGPMDKIHVPLLKSCSANGIDAAVYRGPGAAPYEADVAGMGRACANRQSVIVNHEAVRWFARQYPGCQILEVGSRHSGEAVPPTSLGFNWTGMERDTLGRGGLRTCNPTWPGMEWGARPPSTYIPLGPPRPPVGPPAQTWPGMEWGAPPPSSYMPACAPATRPPGGGGGGVTLYCGLPPPRIPDWARPSGPMRGDMMAGGAMGMGTFGPMAFGGGMLTVDGIQRCANDDPSGVVNAGAGTLLLTSAGSVTLYSGGTFLTGAGYFGAGSTLTAGGTALGTAAVPATLVVVTAAGGYCTGRAIDNASGGRISDGAATLVCGGWDTFANVGWRWWFPGCHTNYDLTRTSASMFGENARCNMRGPSPVCGGGLVQAGGVDPPYEEPESEEYDESLAEAKAAACAATPAGTSSTTPAAFSALLGLAVAAWRQRSRGRGRDANGPGKPRR